MGDIIIGAILVAIVIGAVISSKKHFKGEGGCCGGGTSNTIAKKKLDGEVKATKVMKIDGMHCENCKASVTNAINRIDGASAKVSLGNKTAKIQMDRNIEDDELKRVIEKLGYTVTDIKTL